MTSRSRLVLTVSLVALGLACWFAWRGNNDGSATTLADDDEQPRSQSGLEQRGPHVATRGSSEAPRLSLSIVDASGAAIAGSVHWHASVSPPLWPRRLAPEEDVEEAPRIRTAEHKGSVVLDLDRGAWTWLRVVGRDTTRFMARYERIAPFAGTKNLRIVLDDKQRSIHAFAVEADMQRPAAKARVTVYESDMKQPTQPVAVATQETDADGYVCFRGLAPGGFLVTLGDAKPSDRAPQTQRFVLPDGMPRQELPILLVREEARHLATVSVTQTSLQRGAIPPLLFVRGEGENAGHMMPIGSPLVETKQAFEVELAAGDWHVEVLPIGLYRLQGDRRFTMGRGARATYELSTAAEAHTGSSTVELVGISDRDLPVSVRPRFAGEEEPADADLLFCGPLRWHSRRVENVALPTNRPCKLVVTNRGAQWISHELHGAGQHMARLEAASRFTLHHHGGATWKSPLLLLGNGEQRIAMRPTRQLRTIRGETRPTWTATNIVPRGHWRVQIFESGMQTALWERDVDFHRPQERVVVDAD